MSRRRTCVGCGRETLDFYRAGLCGRCAMRQLRESDALSDTSARSVAASLRRRVLTPDIVRPPVENVLLGILLRLLPAQNVAKAI
jgi:hypothetical protein